MVLGVVFDVAVDLRKIRRFLENGWEKSFQQKITACYSWLRGLDMDSMYTAIKPSSVINVRIIMHRNMSGVSDEMPLLSI